MAIEITEEVRTNGEDMKNVYAKVTGYKVDVVGKEIIAEVRCFPSKTDSEDVSKQVSVKNLPQVWRIKLTDTQVGAANHRKVVYESLSESFSELGYVNARID
jgi:hypothetical protein